MSTLSCQLLLCSSAITEDFYKGFFRPDAPQRELVWVGRIMVLAVAGVAIIIAANPENKVLGLVAYAWAGFGAAFGPLVMLSLAWRRLTEKGALASMITGAVVVVAWAQVANPLLKNSGLPTIYEIVPGFIAATLAAVLVSLKDKSPDENVLKRFDDACQAYDEAVK